MLVYNFEKKGIQFSFRNPEWNDVYDEIKIKKNKKIFQLNILIFLYLFFKIQKKIICCSKNSY